jgi:hypothetical protein
LPRVHSWDGSVDVCVLRGHVNRVAYIFLNHLHVHFWCNLVSGSKNSSRKKKNLAVRLFFFFFFFFFLKFFETFFFFAFCWTADGRECPGNSDFFLLSSIYFKALENRIVFFELRVAETMIVGFCFFRFKDVSVFYFSHSFHFFYLFFLTPPPESRSRRCSPGI